MAQFGEALFEWETIWLELRTPFRVSYGTSQKRLAHWVRLRGGEGWGEGTIPPYYHIEEQAMLDYWQRASERTDPLPGQVSAIGAWVDPDGPAPAKAAIDIALHDYLARKAGQPLFAALGLSRPKDKFSSFTISADTPEAMAAEAFRARHFLNLKLKFAGDGQDMARLKAVREVCPAARLLVDANAAWQFEQAREYLPNMEDCRVALLEQPLGLAEFEGMGRLQTLTSIPIFADESVRTMEDVIRLADVGARGVNIKLMKVGGIRPALEMIHYARKKGMEIMMGCMIETSIGLTAMSHLGSLADWLDLDASLLVRNDPFEGMSVDLDGRVSVPDRPGVGARHREKFD